VYAVLVRAGQGAACAVQLTGAHHVLLVCHALQESELPEALRGLQISKEGDLVDTKTGKVINEFGATRFDVAVRALRGELDPAPWVEVRACLTVCGGVAAVPVTHMPPQHGPCLRCVPRTAASARACVAPTAGCCRPNTLHRTPSATRAC
jgi:hypothetical protein